MKKIIIKKEDSGKRLDIFLFELIKKNSRSQIKKMILGDMVTVNGEMPTVHRFLKEGDIVEIKEGELQNVSSKKKFIKSKLKSFGTEIFSKIKIIDDTPEYLVIEKPSGLLVHPTNKGETNTLVDWLIAKYPECRKIGEDPARAAIVHRLDKEVSGLMVIPKTQDSFENIKRQFKLRTIDKKYLALVYGKIKNDSGEINFPIKRSSSKKGMFAALPIGADTGKKALTVYSVKERYKNYTLLEIEIMTGRTHQIRVHLLAIGHGIVGDPLYKNRGIKEKNTPNRIFLHAAELGFTDLKGERHQYQSLLPQSLRDFLRKIK